MADAHERYEGLALSHVLGGLGSDDAAEFRSHLVGCRECRMRVAELRDIAAELAATEREERRRAAVATEVAHREEEPSSSTARRGWQPWVGRGAVGVAVLLVLGVVFWNYHLRRVSSDLTVAVERQAEVLGVLATGSELPVSSEVGVTGTAARDGDTVAFTLHDLPTVEPGGFVAVWALEADEAELLLATTPPGDGPFAFVDDVGPADALVLTLERVGAGPPPEPGDDALARIDLGR